MGREEYPEEQMMTLPLRLLPSQRRDRDPKDREIRKLILITLCRFCKNHAMIEVLVQNGVILRLYETWEKRDFGSSALSYKDF